MTGHGRNGAQATHHRRDRVPAGRVPAGKRAVARCAAPTVNAPAGIDRGGCHPPDGAAPAAMRTVTTTRSRMAERQRTKPVSAAPGQRCGITTQHSRRQPVRAHSRLRKGARRTCDQVPDRDSDQVHRERLSTCLQERFQDCSRRELVGLWPRSPTSFRRRDTRRCTERQAPTRVGSWLDAVHPYTRGSRRVFGLHPPAPAAANRNARPRERRTIAQPPGRGADPPRPRLETQATAAHAAEHRWPPAEGPPHASPRSRRNSSSVALRRSSSATTCSRNGLQG